MDPSGHMMITGGGSAPGSLAEQQATHPCNSACESHPPQPVSAAQQRKMLAHDNELRAQTPEEEYPSAGMHPAATHVETRAVWFMRNGGPDSMELVINNAGGACEGVFSCSNVIPQILRAGQKMTVWSPDGQGGITSTSFEGEG
jgi:hypothetical protein